MGFIFNTEPKQPGSKTQVTAGAMRTTANSCNMFADSGGSSGGASNGGGYDVSYMTDVTDRLEQGSIVEQWIPRSAIGLNKMFRLMYARDTVAGPTVDLIRTMPFSDYDVIGVDDPTILKTYKDCLEALNIPVTMPEIAGEFLVIGKVISSLIFDTKKGYYTDFVPHDPDFVRITPIPIRGFDPKVDIKPTPGMRMFLTSKDPRDIAARKSLPDQLMTNMMKGDYVPLDPMGTLYLPRKASISDMVGTSYYTRLIYYWAIEKAYINSTVISTRRRARAITHITAGKDGIWEPSVEELQFFTELFTQADEDPFGAIVATREGVQVNEVKQEGQFLKLSEEFDFLNQAKMRALGISEAFLSGDATYANMDNALSVFVEFLRTFRDFMTARVIRKKIFVNIARANGFVKRSKAELSHKVYSSSANIREEDLVLPEIHWNKQLRPEADANYLDILSTMEEKGLPIPLRTWAAAGGIDIANQMKMFPEDTRIRKEIAKWKKASGQGEEEEDTAFASVGATDSIQQRLYQLPVWKDDKFLSLSKAQAYNFIMQLIEKYEQLSDPKETMKIVSQVVEHNAYQRAHLSYLIMRLGLAHQLPISEKITSEIAEYIYAANKDEKAVLTKELMNLKKIVEVGSIDVKPPESKDVSSLMKENAKFLTNIGSSDKLSNTSSTVLTGVG